jgi:hypothetical protein
MLAAAALIPPVESLPFPSSANDWIVYLDPEDELVLYLEHALVQAIGAAVGAYTPGRESPAGMPQLGLVGDLDYRKLFMSIGSHLATIPRGGRAPGRDGRVLPVRLTRHPEAFLLGRFGGQLWAFRPRDEEAGAGG